LNIMSEVVKTLYYNWEKLKTIYSFIG
jgi:hypothetical protein